MEKDINNVRVLPDSVSLGIKQRLIKWFRAKKNVKSDQTLNIHKLFVQHLDKGHSI